MRTLVWKIVRFILFRLDAERAHHLTLRAIRTAWALGPVGKRVLIEISGTKTDLFRPNATVWQLPFQSRVGLAAGFDKNAEILAALPSLGFGFAEIGTVTPLSQPGNPRPRLFRDPTKEIVFNRMGFNGLGAEAVAAHLREAKAHLPPLFRVGVNIGKNKDTPLDQAEQDYVKATRPFEALADYLVINVSSPNTPGLRRLQTIEALEPLIKGVRSVISGWKSTPPLLLKLSPEIFADGNSENDELGDFLMAVERFGIDGWVLTNTVFGTWKGPSTVLEGGLSGSLLTVQAALSLKKVRLHSRLPVISVGGILRPEDARERILAGADLVQIYSGWIFRGPEFPNLISEKLRK